MPTKHFYVGVDPVVAGVRSNSPAERPFQRNFGVGGACHDGGPDIFDREAIVFATVSAAPPRMPITLCWAATVVIYNSSSVLGSANKHDFSTRFSNGWLRIDFRQTLPSGGSIVYHGLPVVGFMVQDFVNGTLQAGDGGRVLSNYGGLFEHKYTQRPTATPLP